MAERALSVEVRGNARSFTATMQNSAGHLRKFEQQVLRTNARIAADMQRVGAHSRAISGGFAAAAAGVRRSGTGIARTTRDINNQLGSVVTTTNRIGRTTQKSGQAAQKSLAGVGIAAGTMARNTNRGLTTMSRGFKDTSAHAGAMHGQFENYAGFVGFQMLGRQAIVMGAMVAAAFALSTKAFADFEDSFALVRKTTEATEVEFEELSDQIRELARTIPLAVTELNEVAAAGGQLGVPSENIAEFTEVMAELGVATDLTAEQAAISMARIAAVMQEGLDDEGVGRMSSALVDLGNNFAARDSEITKFTERIAAAGQVIGMQTPDLFAFSTAFTAVGVKAERGGTAFQRVVFEMMDAVQGMGYELDLLAATAGVSADEFARVWKSDPTEALLMFVEGLAKAGERSNFIMTELFGKNVRITQSFLALAGAGDLARRAVDRGREAFEQNNARAAEAEARFSTLTNRLKVMKNRVVDVAIGIGEQLAPAVETVASAVIKAIEGFNQLPQPLKELGMVLAAVAATAAIVAGSMALMVFPMNVLKGILPQISSNWAAVTGTQKAAELQALRTNMALAQQAGVTTVLSGSQARLLATGAPMPGYFGRLGNAAVTGAGAVGKLAKAIPALLLGLGKLVLPIAAIYGAWKLLSTAHEAVRTEFFEVADAAEQLAESLDITLDSYKDARDEINGKPIVAEFKAQNKELFETFAEMEKWQRSDAVVLLAMELKQRGASAEEIREALLTIQAASPYSIDIDIGMANDSPTQMLARITEQIPQIMAALNDTGAWRTLFGGAHAFNQQLESIAETLGKLGRDDIEKAGLGFEQIFEDIIGGTDDIVDGLNRTRHTVGSFIGSLTDNEHAAKLADQALVGYRRSVQYADQEIQDSITPQEAFRQSIKAVANALADAGMFSYAADVIEMGDAATKSAKDQAYLFRAVDAGRITLDGTAGGVGLYNTDLRGLSTTTAETTDYTAAFVEELDEVVEGAQSATEAIEGLFEEVRGGQDPLIQAMRATRDMEEAMYLRADAERDVAAAREKLNELQEDGEATTTEIAQATRDLEIAERDLRDIVLDMLETNNKYEKSMVDVIASLAEGSTTSDDLAQMIDILRDTFGQSDETLASFTGRLGEVIREAMDTGTMLEALGGDTDALSQLMLILAGDTEMLAEVFGGEMEAAVPRVASALAALGAEEQAAMEISEKIMRDGGAEAAAAFVGELRNAMGSVAGAVQEYARLLADGLNPVLVSIGGKSIVVPKGTYIDAATRQHMQKNAEGGINTALPKRATIERGRGQGLVQWAEGETGGEAFIPLAPSKRRRSLDIWAQTGERLGIHVPSTTMAEGGLTNFEKGFWTADQVPAVPEYPHGGIFKSAESASEVARQKTLAKIAAFAAAMGTGPGSSGLSATKGLNPQFLARFNAWSRATGPYSITSGYRSSAQQAILYARYKAGRGALAAPPGRSMHEKGLAIDHAPHSWPIAATARPFGLHHPVRSESWHVEPRAHGGIFNGVQQFDNGGLLKPGATLAVNRTGSPEAVTRFADGGLHDSLRIPADQRPPVRGFGTGVLGGPGGGALDPFVHRRLTLVGDTADVLSDAIIDATRALQEWERQIKAADESARRAGLEQNIIGARKEISSAEDAEARAAAREREADAVRALQEFDVSRARENERAQAQRRIQRAEEELAIRRQIEENKELFHFERMSTEEQIADLTRRMEHEREFTDEWISLHKQRERLLEEQRAKEEDNRALEERIHQNKKLFDFERMSTQQQIADLSRRIAAERAFTDEWMSLTQKRIDLAQQEANTALSGLNTMLDDRRNILDSIADVEKRHEEAVAAAHARFASARSSAAKQRGQTLRDIEQRSSEERKRIVEDRISSLRDSLDMETKAAREWANSIPAILRNEAQRAIQREEWEQGLDVLREMGLSEEAIGTFGLEELNEQSLAKVRMWSKATEAEIAALNEAVVQRHTWAADRVTTEEERQIGAVGEALAEMAEMVSRETAAAHSSYAASVSSARSELNKELEELDKQLEEDMKRLEEDLDNVGKDQGRTYAEAIAEGIASGLPAIMDQVNKVKEAMSLLKEAKKGTNKVLLSDTNLRDYAKKIGYTSDLSLLRERVATRGYDSGGVLPPGLTMAYNGTRQAEYVLRQSKSTSNEPAPVYVTVENVMTLDGRVISREVTQHQEKGERRILVQAGKRGTL